MSNNEIMKKLRVALKLTNDDILEILSLVKYQISKGALGDIFRSEDHESFMPCKDQLLRNFLNGLVIYNRGTKENPQPPRIIMGQEKEQSSPQRRSREENKEEPKFKSDPRPQKNMINDHKFSAGRITGDIRDNSDGKSVKNRHIESQYRDTPDDKRRKK